MAACLLVQGPAFATGHRDGSAAQPKQRVPALRPAHGGKPVPPGRVHTAQNRPLIVIDAGHGGRDPGAIGPSGTQEKAVALATAHELARQLRATRRFRILLTRSGDRFVPLATRLRTVARSRAALMVSIHADAAPDPKVRGASVYVRSGGSDGTITQMPAHRGAAPSVADALAGARPPSELLQKAVLGALDDDLMLRASPARRARLYVLAATDVPGVLVEMGTISNLRDEALLRTSRHRSTIARAVREAIEAYFRNQPEGGARPDCPRARAEPVSARRPTQDCFARGRTLRVQTQLLREPLHEGHGRARIAFR